MLSIQENFQGGLFRILMFGFYSFSFGKLLVCLVFFFFLFLNVWASIALQFLILCLDFLIQLCLLADVHNLKKGFN